MTSTTLDIAACGEPAAAYGKRTGIPRRLQSILSLDDFEHAARGHLPRPLFGYIAGAAEDNASLLANRSAFQDYAFRTRVMVDVSKRHQKTTVFGTTYQSPFGIAPVGISAISAYRGDLVLATAAEREGVPAIMSGTSLIKMEDVARAAPSTWFQAYLPGDVSKIDALVERIDAAGFKTLVITVDIPVWANRENNVRTGFSKVVPKQVLEDQQVIALKDALKNVSGVQRSASAGNLYDGFIIRGFENDANIYRNGLRSCCFRYETANLEQIEVLKGPAAVLYGRIEPGGLVNLVTKRPLEQPYYALEQQFGSYDLYRTVAEATGPITSDGSLLYRFDLAYQSNNSFRDFVDLERVFISPSLTWRLSERTELNLNVEYQDDTMQDDSGIPAIGRRPAPVPINRYLQDDVAVDETDRVLVELSWLHRFSEHWTLRNRFQANLTDYDQTIVTPAGFLDDRTLDRGL